MPRGRPRALIARSATHGVNEDGQFCQHVADTRISAASAESNLTIDLIGERGGTRTLDPMIKSYDFRL